MFQYHLYLKRHMEDINKNHIYICLDIKISFDVEETTFIFKMSVWIVISEKEKSLVNSFPGWASCSWYNLKHWEDGLALNLSHYRKSF